jgi:Ca-activated chloride channel family protein
VFEFEYPWVLALLPAPALVWWLLPAYREQRESVRVPFFERIAAAIGRTPSRGGTLMRRNVLQWVIAPLAWGMVLVSVARPQYVEPPLERVEPTRDLLLAVDLSGSMEFPDMFDEEGNRIGRLDAVKTVLGDFVARREGDRLALIVFGNQAFVQAPFTLDSRLVRQLLEQLQPRLAGPQTMIGDAIGLAIKTFESSEAEDRLLVLLTDGNDTGSRVPPTKAAELAAQNDITIHTIAFGAPESAGEGEMDLETLGKIAEVTGGTAFRADDREQLEQIYRDLDNLAPVEVETISYRPTRPLFHWPLAGAVALLLLYHFVMGIRQAVRAFGARHA